MVLHGYYCDVDGGCDNINAQKSWLTSMRVSFLSSFCPRPSTRFVCEPAFSKKHIHLCNVHRQIWCAIHGLCGYCSPNVVCFRSWFRYMHPVKAQSMCPVAPAETTNVVKPTKAMCLQGVYREWPSLRQKAWNVDHKRSAHAAFKRFPGCSVSIMEPWPGGSASRYLQDFLRFPQLACIPPTCLH